MIGYVDSAFCGRDRKNRILCCITGVAMKEISGLLDAILLGHGGGTLIVGCGKNMFRGFKGEVLIIGLSINGKYGFQCNFFSGILPRM